MSTNYFDLLSKEQQERINKKLPRANSKGFAMQQTLMRRTAQNGAVSYIFMPQELEITDLQAKEQGGRNTPANFKFEFALPLAQEREWLAMGIYESEGGVKEPESTEGVPKPTVPQEPTPEQIAAYLASNPHLLPKAPALKKEPKPRKKAATPNPVTPAEND